MNGMDGPWPLVPARPRDGVPVAFDVAQAPLGLVVVRTIKAPGVPESGMTGVRALVDAVAEPTKESGPCSNWDSAGSATYLFGVS